MTREEAIRMLSNRDAHGVPCGYTSGYQEAFDMAVDALQYLQEWGDVLQGRPVKHGKWIVIDDTHSQCTECGAIFCITSSDEWEVNFCPNCGARMDKE